MKLPLAALVLALAAAPAAAYPLNFGNAYVSPPGHGLVIAQPTYALNGSGYATFGFVSAGLADHLALGPLRAVGVSLESTYVAGPGFNSDFANTLVTLPCDLGALTMGPVAGLKVGAYGRNFVGLRAFFDRPLRPDLTAYLTAGYYYSPDGQPDPHRVKLDGSLDYHGLAGWDFNLEAMAGSPTWDYGPNTRLALAPGLARSVGPVTLFASLRVPVIAVAGSASTEPPIALAGVVYAW